MANLVGGKRIIIPEARLGSAKTISSSFFCALALPCPSFSPTTSPLAALDSTEVAEGVSASGNEKTKLLAIKTRQMKLRTYFLVIHILLHATIKFFAVKFNRRAKVKF